MKPELGVAEIENGSMVSVVDELLCLSYITRVHNVCLFCFFLVCFYLKTSNLAQFKPLQPWPVT